MIKLYYNSRGGRIPLHFSAPDDGGASGGAASSGAGKEEAVKTPFDNLPWDELEDKDRVELEKARDTFVATLQSEAKLKGELEREKGLSSKFQSESDRLKAERDKQSRNEPDKKDPTLDACIEELKNAGYPDDQAVKLAPVFAGMFKRVGIIQKQDIGKDLAPMAHGVLANQATTAFQQAQQQDVLGALKVPEVAQGVWNHVTEMVKQGQQVTVDVVANLGKMAWSDHIVAEIRAGRTPTLPAAETLPATPPISGMNTGGFNFPGATLTPIAKQPTDSNPATHALNADTRAALATSFKSMLSDMPKLMPENLKSATSTRRNR